MVDGRCVEEADRGPDRDTADGRGEAADVHADDRRAVTLHVDAAAVAVAMAAAAGLDDRRSGDRADDQERQ